jgi:hypothetical protein
MASIARTETHDIALLERSLVVWTLEFPSILWNPKVQYRIHKSSPPVPIPSQTSPIHITPSHLYKIPPNIIHAWVNNIHKK